MLEEVSPLSGASDPPGMWDNRITHAEIGAPWLPVTPTQINVRRSAGGTERDWEIIAYNPVTRKYRVAKQGNGVLLKDIPTDVLSDQNDGRELPLPPEEQIAEIMEQARTAAEQVI